MITKLNKRTTVANLGLLNNFKSEIQWVPTKYQTNPLSHINGGYDVVIEYRSNKILGYKRIKSPSLYISAIFYELINMDKEDFECYDEQKQLSKIKNEIKAIYVRSSTDADELPFQVIWYFKFAKVVPWEVLEKFDAKSKKTSEMTIIKDDNLLKQQILEQRKTINSLNIKIESLFQINLNANNSIKKLKEKINHLNIKVKENEREYDDLVLINRDWDKAYKKLEKQLKNEIKNLNNVLKIKDKEYKKVILITHEWDKAYKALQKK